MSLRRYDDWDRALDEAYLRDVLAGRIVPQPEVRYTCVEDYGRTVRFTVDEVKGVVLA